MIRALCLKIASAVMKMDFTFVKWHLSRIADKNAKRHTWKKECSLLLEWLKDTSQEPPYKVFTLDKKAKVPFYTFSVLPIVTCPGAGDCARFCYSLKAWRYPCAFLRQLQNTILILLQSDHLTAAFNALPIGTDLRLYVDGDFDSYETICFWFALLETRHDLNVYGYSKSWEELIEYGTFPSNYTLNVSSGSIHTEQTKQDILKLARGEFIALPVDKGLQGKYGTKEYKASLRQSASAAGIDRYFACPGLCGSCTKKGHACGSDRFQDVPILIGIH